MTLRAINLCISYAGLTISSMAAGINPSRLSLAIACFNLAAFVLTVWGYRTEQRACGE